MKLREATVGDRERLHELYAEFVREIPPPPEIPIDLDHELAELDEYLAEPHISLVVEDDGAVVGFALAKLEEPGIGHLSDLYVAPDQRRRGAATELIRGVATRLHDAGAAVLMLEVQLDNPNARAAYERVGFKAGSVSMYAPLAQLLRHTEGAPRGPSFGSVHVQTDDDRAVAQAVRKYVPRLGRSCGSIVSGPRNGWIAVYDELADREPATLRRLASELSAATGAVVLSVGIEEGAVVRYVLFERGSVVDEYLSVPEYYKALPPGDAIALGANPTVVARLTGADPREIRTVARTAATPDDLPPPQELLVRIAELVGISGAAHGYEGAADEPRAQEITHG